MQNVLLGIDALLGGSPRDGFDTAHASSHTAFAQNADKADAARALGVATAAELYAVGKLNHADAVAVFLAEEGDGSQFLGLFKRHVAVLLQGDVLTNAGVDDALHLAQLFARHLPEMAKVKAQVFAGNERTLLLYVCAQHFAEGLVEQVGGGMVGLAGVAGLDIYFGVEGSRGILGQFLREMERQVVLALRIKDFHGFRFAHKHALVALLSTHFGIEGRSVEHEFIERLLLLLHAAVAEDMAVVLRLIPADELRFAFAEYHPVVGLHGGSVACTILLLLHLGVEGGLVNTQAVLGTDEFRQVEGEAVRIEEGEGFRAVHHGLASLLRLIHHAFQQVDTRGQGAQEGLFLLLHHTADELLLTRQLGISMSHLLNERGQEFVHKGFALAKEGVGVANSAAQDAADDVARLGVGGQLAVGNTESDGAQVVGDDAHGHVNLLFATIFKAAEFANLANDGLEYVSIVVGVLALHHAHQTLEAHSRIYDLGRQGFERAIGFAVVLHEDEVPNFDNLGIVLVDQFGTAKGSLFFLGAVVDVNLGARTAGTRVTHFPEVVVLVAIDDMVFGEEFLPIACGFVVAAEAFLFAALKDRHVEVLGIDFQDVHQVGVGPADGFLLEIIAETPVAQHFEHRMVIRVVAHFFEVVVLARNAEALLRVALTARFGFHIAQNDVLELVHSGVRKHKRGVILDDHRSRRHHEVALLLKESFERFAYFVGCHIFLDVLFSAANLQKNNESQQFGTRY